MAPKTVTNYRTTSSYLNDLAMSSTYCIASKLALAIIYGCTPESQAQIEQRIGWAVHEQAATIASHPLLLAGILVEMERKRLNTMVDMEIDATFVRTDLHLPAYRSRIDTARGREDVSRRDLGHFQSTRTLSTNIQATIFELEKLARAASETHPSVNSEHNITGRMIRQRTLEIIDELKIRVEECTNVVQNITVAAQVVSACV